MGHRIQNNDTEFVKVQYHCFFCERVHKLSIKLVEPQQYKCKNK